MCRVNTQVSTFCSCCAAQAQLEEDMKKAAGEGQVHLDAQLQAECYKIQEEAKSKTSKLRTDHEALKATQASPVLPSTTLLPSTARLSLPSFSAIAQQCQGSATCHLPERSAECWESPYCSARMRNPIGGQHSPAGDHSSWSLTSDCNAQDRVRKFDEVASLWVHCRRRTARLSRT